MVINSVVNIGVNILIIRSVLSVVIPISTIYIFSIRGLDYKRLTYTSPFIILVDVINKRVSDTNVIKRGNTL